VQASPAWTPPTGTLGRIVAETRQRVEELLSRGDALEKAASQAPTPPSFARGLAGVSVAVIAEVKRRSPSKGSINEGLTASEQAHAYERGGAAAVSVLTEPNHFGGSATDLTSVRQAVRIPTLKKDFHVHPIQLTEARALRASAALLIARALSPADLRTMSDAAKRLELEVLIEVRDEEELERALEVGATIVGVNNRNLETLAIDPATSDRLLPLIPPHVVAIAESGVSSRADVERFARAGADAVLVGSSISAAADPIAAVASLTGVGRQSRVR
jgi:indole-3-glycerol phosphate synthase